jgi:hypothetical protein
MDGHYSVTTATRSSFDYFPLAGSRETLRTNGVTMDMVQVYALGRRTGRDVKAGHGFTG